jgi:pimeloyl-ACP methyl ester carboxylesterase
MVLVASLGALRRGGSWSVMEQLLYLSEPLQSWAIASGRARSAIARMGETSFNGEPPEWWREQTHALLAFRGASHSWIMELKYRDAETLDGVDLHVPTSIVHGASDQLSALAVGEDLNRRIAGSKLTIVEGGSHMLPNTHPELIVEQIRAQLYRSARTAAR